MSEVTKKHVILVVKKGKKVQSYKDKLVCKSNGTRKCGCPFKLKERFMKIIGWRLTVVCGFHNNKS